MSVYSIDNLKEVMGDDPEFIAVVVQTFLDEIPPDLEGLIAAVAEGDRKRAYGFAHKMKPNIEMFGVDLMKSIRSIETWSRSSKDIDAVQPLVDEVNEVLQAVFIELRQDFNL
ncbi:Hpt domain-containing protein [Flavobacteriaceae bacterium]|nr:Hpt domain-containing protein [Flavobacteriaceae bacterium]